MEKWAHNPLYSNNINNEDSDERKINIKGENTVIKQASNPKENITKEHQDHVSNDDKLTMSDFLGPPLIRRNLTLINVVNPIMD